jgi:DNA-binding CsgD family transcriptional regulator
MPEKISDRLNKINELVAFLNRPVLTLEDLTRYLTLKTFSSFGAFALYIANLTAHGVVEFLETFGLTSEQLSGWDSVPLSAEVPVADAIREDRLVWLSDSHDWDEIYPGTRNLPGSEKLKTIINAPLYLTGAPVGAMGVMCEQQILPATEELAFVDIVAGLLSLHLSKSQNHVDGVADRKKFLTNRQLEVLRLMCNQMTNAEIASHMGYSVSTIRHETMRIYELFKASGRRDAVKIAKEHNIV